MPLPLPAEAGASANVQPALREEVRDRIKRFKDNKQQMNILVVGRVGAGKSTLINSAHMAVSQTWNELAWYGGGDAANNTLFLTPLTMFKSEFMRTPIVGYKDTIKMWDFAGMENLEEDSYIELIGLTLEGRVPEHTSVLPLLKRGMTPQKLSAMFPKSASTRRFNRVIMVCDADKDVPENLVKTVRRASKTQEGRQIPIVVVISKLDKCRDSPEYRQRKEAALSAFQLKGNQERFFETGLYSDLNSNCSRARGRKFNPNAEIDRTLLEMWSVLLNPAYDESVDWEGGEHSETSWCSVH